MKKRLLTAFLLLILTFCAVVFAPVLTVDAKTQVKNEAELISALENAAVIEIELSGIIELNQSVNITNNCSLAGGSISFAGDCSLNVQSGADLKLSNIGFSSEEGYCIICRGTLRLSNGVVLSGDKGIRLDNGADLFSDGKEITVLPETAEAIGVYPDGESTTLSDVFIYNGGDCAIRLYGSGGELAFSGECKIDGGGVSTEGGAHSPALRVSAASILIIEAEKEEKAIDISSAFSLESGAAAHISGGDCAVSCKSLTLGEKASLFCSAERKGLSNSGEIAALRVLGAIDAQTDVSVKIGGDLPASCCGIYCVGEINTDSGFNFTMLGDGGQYSAIYSVGEINLGDNSSVVITDVQNGIISERGFYTGNICNISISGISQYAMRATGSYLADKISFGTGNLIDLEADYCALRTAKALELEKDGVMTIKSGSIAPALWVETSGEILGHLLVTAAKLNVESSADKYAAVSVRGSIIFEQGSEILIDNSSKGDGIYSPLGDLNISTKSKLFVSGARAVELIGGSVRLTARGELYAEGRRGAGLHISEGGTVNIGDECACDIQGATDGIEIIGNGGLWLSSCEGFDIRGVSGVAVRLDDGSFTVDGIERISAWLRDVDGENTSCWWSAEPAVMSSWGIIPSMSKDKLTYADYSIKNPRGSQSFTDGKSNQSTLNLSNGEQFDISLYSRLGEYTTRPVARSNNFTIQSGKSFAWRLYGESWLGDELKFSLVNSNGDSGFELGEDGSFRYTAPNVAGEESFDYIVSDIEGTQSLVARIIITVTRSKQPIAYSASFPCEQNGVLDDMLKVYDYDGTIASTYVSSEPEHGKLTLNSDGTFRYTPDESFTGIERFEYYCTDNVGDKSALGYVSIAVGENAEPVAVNDTLISECGVPVSKALRAFGGDDLSFEITVQPKYGTLTLSNSGEATYTPYEDFAGADSFYFTVTSDSIRSQEGIVTVFTTLNQRPTANSGGFICRKNSAVSGRLSGSDTDGTIKSFKLVKEPENGQLTLNERTGEFSYIPELGYTGVISVSFTALDNDNLRSDESTVTIEVLPFVDYLNRTGELTGVLIMSGVAAFGVTVLLFMLISYRVRRRSEERLEERRRSSENNY